MGGAAARSFTRVGACADELRLMGVERDGEPAGVGRAGGGLGSLASKIVECLWTTRYGAYVERSLGGRRELHDATRGERRTSEGSSLVPSGALSGNEGE